MTEIRSLEEEDHAPLLAVWTTRALLTTQVYRGLLRASSGRGPFDVVGEPSLKSSGVTPDKARKRLTRRLDALREKPTLRKGPLFDNVACLGTKLGLTGAEKEVLLFAVVLAIEPPLQTCFEELEGCSIRRVEACLAEILEVERAEVRRALSEAGTLARTGLVRMCNEQRRAWREPLELMPGLADLLYAEYATPSALLARLFEPAPPATLSLDDFPHLSRDVRILKGFVARTVAERAAGVNILLYGPPGTGKTELARALAAATGTTLYAVGVEGERGEPLCARERFARYQLCQLLLGRRPSEASLVLFDEIEDVFPKEAGSSRPDTTASGENKGWTNRLLEENPVPTVWVGNHASQIDAAFVRRFDYVLEVGVPPEPVRRRILERHLSGSASSHAVSMIAADERFRPADVARAVRVATLAAVEGDGRFEESVLRVLSNRARAQGATSPRRCRTNEGPYDLRFLNASHDPVELVAALEQRPAGSICLYGPPGTGKTAFVHHVSKRIGRPLIAKRASEILSCWVGETETNLAEMFARASDEGAILLLDEADSFLRERSGAQKSWEVTQVNELLVQMESFEGLFFCATNAFESLDLAALRRFALKIRFSALTSAQRWSFFREVAPNGDLDHLRARVERMDGLTAGDFGVIARQNDVLGRSLAAEALCAALEAELKTRARSGRTVTGFVERPRARSAGADATSTAAQRGCAVAEGLAVGPRVVVG